MADEMDSMQTPMLSLIAKVPRLAHESPDSYFRKRQRTGRQLAVQCGLWSSVWVKRMLDGMNMFKLLIVINLLAVALRVLADRSSTAMGEHWKVVSQ